MEVQSITNQGAVSLARKPVSPPRKTIIVLRLESIGKDNSNSERTMVLVNDLLRCQVIAVNLSDGFDCGLVIIDEMRRFQS
jgi:hypothetical protein